MPQGVVSYNKSHEPLFPHSLTVLRCCRSRGSQTRQRKHFLYPAAITVTDAVVTNSGHYRSGLTAALRKVSSIEVLLLMVFTHKMLVTKNGETRLMFLSSFLAGTTAATAAPT